MYVCICQGKTDADIKQAVSDGAKTVKELSDKLGIIVQRGHCACEVQKIVKEGV